MMSGPSAEKSDETKNFPYKPIALFALGLGVLFDYSFYKQPPGLSYPIYLALVLAAVFLLARRFKVGIRPAAPVFAVLSVFFGAMVYLRAGDFLTFLNLCASLYLLTLVADEILGMKADRFAVFDYIKIPLLLTLDSLTSFFSALSDWQEYRAGRKSESPAAALVRGVLLALPILALLLVLLSTADLVFKGYVEGVLDWLTIETAFRAVSVTIAAAAFIGIFTYLFVRPEAYPTDTGGTRSFFGFIEGATLLTAVNGLFAFFIAIQFFYLFGGKKTLALKGVTYAQYARRGFFELLAVAVLAFGIIWLTDKYMSREKGRQALFFQGLSFLLVVEVVLIIFSALKRLLLYESAFGFTITRFYAHAFILWLAVVFLILTVKIVAGKREGFFAFPAFLAFLLGLAMVNFFNPDAYIASRNIDRPSSRPVDLAYLSTLSNDAVGEIVRALETADSSPTNVQAVSQDLLFRREQLERLDKSWQGMNLARARALAVLRQKSAFLKAKANLGQGPGGFSDPGATGQPANGGNPNNYPNPEAYDRPDGFNVPGDYADPDGN